MNSIDPWQKISVCVITLNEEENLSRCLRSVIPCHEIIVVDSGSTDGTRGVAESFGARWFEHAWEGFAKQRCFAESHATGDWILFLDADETLTQELRNEISEKLKNSQAAQSFYQFKRESQFLNHTVLHGDWKNDWVARLTPRGLAQWQGIEPHPYLSSHQLQLRSCRHSLNHRPYRNLDVFKNKIENYAQIWAQEMAKTGKKSSSIQGILRAGWRFLRSYLFRLGFLDGYAGFQIAWQTARMVYLKYLFLSKISK